MNTVRRPAAGHFDLFGSVGQDQWIPRPRRASILVRLFEAVRTWGHRMRLADELNALSERQLKDIGVTRADFPAILDGSFVRQAESVPPLWSWARTRWLEPASTPETRLAA